MMSAAGPPARRVRSSSRRSSGKWSSRNNRVSILAAGIFCMGSCSLFPILVLETSSPSSSTTTTPRKRPSASVEHLLQAAKAVPGLLLSKASSASRTNSQNLTQARPRNNNNKKKLSLLDLTPDDGYQERPLARGVSGRDMVETPALVGAHRAHIACDVNVDSLAYWNDPQGTHDENFVSAFQTSSRPTNATEPERYITFSPDPGGWNNIRMSMEVIFIIAAASGRTLVLPPKAPLYLLSHAKTGPKHRGFADFYPLDTLEFQKRVKVISMQEFLDRVGAANGPLPIPEPNRTDVTNAADHCDRKSESTAHCGPLYDYLETVGYVPDISATKTCLVFDENKFHGQTMTADAEQHVKTYCGPSRNLVYWDQTFHNKILIHFKASAKNTRLLAHFYSMLLFTDPKIDHYYKRFVRDFLHYHDAIFCAAGKVVKAVQAEAAMRGFPADDNGAGGYSALHVRRGDLQYKKVKISASEWYENTKEVWKPKELLYVATDERDKSFFNDLANHHDLRFLDDYWDLAGLGDLDGNYMGMIDTIVASRGRAFAGTWFSTFSGFINRMRGYHGLSMQDTWYSFLPKKTAVHEWPIVDEPRYAFEWPDGWIGIDADVWPTRDKF